MTWSAHTSLPETRVTRTPDVDRHSDLVVSVLTGIKETADQGPGCYDRFMIKE